MNRTDFWFLTKVGGGNSSDPLPAIGPPMVPKQGKRTFFGELPFNPVNRVVRTYGLTKLDSTSLLRVDRQYTDEYEVRINLLHSDRGNLSDEDKLSSEGIVDDSEIHFGRNYDSPFLLSAWSANFIETNKNFVSWHKAGSEIVHTETMGMECYCTNPISKKYYGPDQLVRWVVKAISYGLHL